MEYAHFFGFLAAQDRRGISTCQRPKVYTQFDEIWGNEPIWKKSENKVTNNVKYQKESAAVIIADWWAADRELSFFIIGREKKEIFFFFLLSSCGWQHPWPSALCGKHSAFHIILPAVCQLMKLHSQLVTRREKVAISNHFSVVVDLFPSSSLARNKVFFFKGEVDIISQ